MVEQGNRQTRRVLYGTCPVFRPPVPTNQKMKMIVKKQPESVGTGKQPNKQDVEISLIIA
ncbi:MAG TPA: hypothetical protein ENI88_12140 [Desulfobulbus sp.]|nr:hypothetical protein [Desulfobulbus sp.]